MAAIILILLIKITGYSLELYSNFEKKISYPDLYYNSNKLLLLLLFITYLNIINTLFIIIMNIITIIFRPGYVWTVFHLLLLLHGSHLTNLIYYKHTAIRQPFYLFSIYLFLGCVCSRCYNDDGKIKQR